ncbi:hypothetical protein IWX49DRAFT_325703 [Phyllosticta citricarpa]|uniref:Uncharacterized protein n=1 Tax=Phyllosticta citricarpa TaxID=55181 RepID=A0ABR1LMS2_9PEZI
MAREEQERGPRRSCRVEMRNVGSATLVCLCSSYASPKMRRLLSSSPSPPAKRRRFTTYPRPSCETPAETLSKLQAPDPSIEHTRFVVRPCMNENTAKRRQVEEMERQWKSMEIWRKVRMSLDPASAGRTAGRTLCVNSATTGQRGSVLRWDELVVLRFGRASRDNSAEATTPRTQPLTQTLNLPAGRIQSILLTNHPPPRPRSCGQTDRPTDVPRRLEED